MTCQKSAVQPAHYLVKQFFSMIAQQLFGKYLCEVQPTQQPDQPVWHFKKKSANIELLMVQRILRPALRSKLNIPRISLRYPALLTFAQ